MFRHEATSEPAGSDTRPAGRAAATRIPLVVLLVAMVLVGLRGTLTTPHWDGPLHTDGTAVGLVLALALAGLLTATLIRGRQVGRRPEPEPAAVARLRGWLRAALSAGLIAVVILTLISAHLHLFGKGGRVKIPPPGSQPVFRPTPVTSAPPTVPASTVLTVLYALLIGLGVAIAVFFLVMVLRNRRPVRWRPAAEVEFDPARLRAAVSSGQAALRELDDARAAIIACYVAMEQSLAQKGAARAVADTPDELLARATAEGIVHGQAAGRLTRLFYEARFSRHPLGGPDREQAARALDELAEELRAPEPASSSDSGGTGTGTGSP